MAPSITASRPWSGRCWSPACVSTSSTVRAWVSWLKSSPRAEGSPASWSRSRTSEALPSRGPSRALRGPVAPPQMGERSLPRPALRQVLALVESPVFHHEPYGLGVVDVIQRILVQHDQVGHLARFERAQIPSQSDRLGAE